MRFFGGGVGHSYRAMFRTHQQDAHSGDLPRADRAAFEDELKLRDNELDEGEDSGDEQDRDDEHDGAGEDGDDEFFEQDAEDGEGHAEGEEATYGMAPL